MNKLEDSLGKEWYTILNDEFKKPYMGRLRSFIIEQKRLHTIYPPSNEVFNAYKMTPYDKVRVCIVGKDPYINNFEAHGIAFSTYNNQYTPSLRQMEKAIRRDVYGGDINYIWYNNLTNWTQQGVMLLNRVLTVNSGKSGSHEGQGWEYFTGRTILELDRKGVIFLLWGKDAQSFKSHIKNSVIIECEHPVASSYQKRDWDNKNCFNRVNEILVEKIIW